MRYGEYKQHINENVYQNATTGYVLTPSELAYEMVSTLPDSVFESDNTTFLDPICKSGTFLFEIIERLYDNGHSVSNIQSRIFTIDSNSHSLNIAKSVIRRILNKESGSFTFNTKIDFIEKYFNRLINFITKGKFKTISEFLNIIVLDKKDKHLMVLLKNNISSFIEKYEKVSKLESKLFGEVFTPRQLIDEMLDTLPKEVWTNPDLKWLDPAVGIGNFPTAILERLMVGLDSIIPNEDDRRKHILEEMLYFCDISTKNLFLLYMLFDKNNEFNLNVYRGSFLEHTGDKISDGFIKFLDGKKIDIIVGNPPYNWSDGANQRKNNRENLWTRFIVHGFNLISDGGFMCFVTPKSWMSPSADYGKVHILDIFSKNNPIYVNIDKCSRYFNVGSSFSYYTICKSKNERNTIVETLDSKFIFDFSTQEIFDVPTLFNDLTISISKKFFSSSVEKFSFKQRGINTRGEKFESSPEGEYINECFHTHSKKVLYSRFVSEDKGKKKAIICLSGLYSAIVDVTGDISQTGMSCVHLIDSMDNINNIDIQLNSKLYKFVMNTLYKYNGWVNMRCVYKLPKIDVNYILNDQLIYEYFDLTQQEIDLIENH